MAFLWNKQGRKQLPTSGMDDADFVESGIRYNVTFLGSIMVPTSTGNGSMRAAAAVEKVYLEKYKAFGYGSKKVAMEVCVDEIKITGKDGDSNTVVHFQTSAITYFNLDLKHDKSFVFIAQNEKDKNYRAYVFHCDSPTRAREIFSKFKEAFKISSVKSEEIRLRSLSLPNKNQSLTEKTADDQDVPEPERDTVYRPRSQTDGFQNKNEFGVVAPNHWDRDGEVDRQPEVAKMEIGNIDEGEEDEFTLLAEKRLRSFDDKAKKGSFEHGLLLQSGVKPQQNTAFQSGERIGNGFKKYPKSEEKACEIQNLLDI